MILTTVFAQGFRCFGVRNPLELDLRPGINVLVGENDAGKTAVVDAIRLALGARSEEFARLTDDDFHLGPDGRVAELVVRCTLDDLDDAELRRFLEWCVIEDRRPRLHIHVSGRMRTSRTGSRRVWCDHRAGRAGDGPAIDGVLREYLRVAYLRPLRDAERQLRAGKRSRLSQILGALPQMQTQGDADVAGEGTGPKTLGTLLHETHKGIRENPAISAIEDRLNADYLRTLLFEDDALVGRLGIGADMTLMQILERLELVLDAPGTVDERVPRGLGINNLLFMAAELLLLQSADDQMPTLVIEEPEAHLHPQLQARFMQMLEGRLAATPKPQVILTTHSPLLAASADLESMVLCKGAELYSLRSGVTKLEASDYAFLRRFLDSTKANLFFARGVLVVEGDAENLLLPVLAEKLGRSLAGRGVSIVKVGHTGLFRYSRIFQRTDLRTLPIPVACIGDRDIPPAEARGLDGDRPKKVETDYTNDDIAKKEATLRRDEGGPVRVFIAKHWTLEYDIAMCGMAVELHQATALAARGDGDETKEDDDAKRKAARVALLASRRSEVEAWRTSGQSDAQIACRVFKPLYCGDVSKAQVAEQLAALLDALPPKDVVDRVPKYLVDAIAYVTTSVRGLAATEDVHPGTADAP